MDINSRTFVDGHYEEEIMANSTGKPKKTIFYNNDDIYVIPENGITIALSNSTYHPSPARNISMLKPNRVIFNNLTTVVYWEDGTKTVVKCSENETFIPEVGLAMAFIRKLYPNRSEFLRFLKNAHYQESKEDKNSDF